MDMTARWEEIYFYSINEIPEHCNAGSSSKVFTRANNTVHYSFDISCISHDST